MSKRILECSSAGDARFSAFYAQVEINGVTASIEEHYQLSKRFYSVIDKKYVVPVRVDEAKGKSPIHFVANGLPYDTKYLEAWYVYLWIMYLDNNPMLVNILAHYDDYNDKFKSSSTINCQADVIRDYMFFGRDYLWDKHVEFYDMILPAPKKNRRKDQELSRHSREKVIENQELSPDIVGV